MSSRSHNPELRQQTYELAMKGEYTFITGAAWETLTHEQFAEVYEAARLRKEALDKQVEDLQLKVESEEYAMEKAVGYIIGTRLRQSDSKHLQPAKDSAKAVV